MAISNGYKTAAANSTSSTIGSVHGSEIRQYVFDIEIGPVDEYSTAGTQEFILRVNGRVIRRMNEYQARRLGLIGS